MKKCLLFLTVLLFNIIIAQVLEDKNDPPGDKIQTSVSTRVTDSIGKTKTLIDIQPNGWTLGYNKELNDGCKKYQRGWFWGSFAGDVVTSCIEGDIIWLVAKNTEDTPQLIPDGDKEYQAGDPNGYKESSKSRGVIRTSGLFKRSRNKCSCRNSPWFLCSIPKFKHPLSSPLGVGFHHIVVKNADGSITNNSCFI